MQDHDIRSSERQLMSDGNLDGYYRMVHRLLQSSDYNPSVGICGKLEFHYGLSVPRTRVSAPTLADLKAKVKKLKSADAIWKSIKDACIDGAGNFNPSAFAPDGRALHHISDYSARYGEISNRHQVQLYRRPIILIGAYRFDFEKMPKSSAVPFRIPCDRQEVRAFILDTYADYIQELKEKHAKRLDDRDRARLARGVRDESREKRLHRHTTLHKLKDALKANSLYAIQQILADADEETRNIMNLIIRDYQTKGKL